MLRQPNGYKLGQRWLVLLIAPFIGVLWVPFFNQVEPELWGIPFFFWYQFLWVLISAAVTAFVYSKVAPSLAPVSRSGREGPRR